MTGDLMITGGGSCVEGAVVARTNERTGVTRYWLVKVGYGPDLERYVDEAITNAIVTGSVGSKMIVSGDAVPQETHVEVVELIERKPYEPGLRSFLAGV
jgi:hypothetical protein